MKKKVVTISLIAIFSIGLWISVALSEVYITTVEIPVRFTDLPKNYAVGSTSVDNVYLQVKGKGWELAKLKLVGDTEFNISVHRRTSKYRSDLNNFIDANPWLASSFQVLEIAPAQIEYEIERIGSKRVPVVQNLKIDFKPGFGPASKIKIEPGTVEISGPANLLQKIDAIKTEFREFTDINDNVKLVLPLDVPDGITIPKTECSIEFEVQKIVDKTFESILIETRNVPPNKELILYPAKINVVLRGGINKLGRLTNDSIKVYVDFWTALKENGKTIEPIIEFPQFTTLTITQPKKLEYIIKQY
ncbi:MAG: YbbR-like domain-containing protein [Ignavibacteriales bacterium]|nr:MAG: YbbR-like domain-containing protein [Ignavibacteriales bacterium]